MQSLFPISKGYNPVGFKILPHNWLPRALWIHEVTTSPFPAIHWIDAWTQHLWSWIFNIICEIWKPNKSNAHSNICIANALKVLERHSVNIIWHTSHTHRHQKLHSGPPLTGHTLSQAITSSLTHSHLVFTIIWFNPKDHQKGFHSPNWQTLNFHLFLLGARCLPFLPLKTSHHLTSNKGKISANPQQKYWSNTDCACFSCKHTHPRAIAQIYTEGHAEKSTEMVQHWAITRANLLEAWEGWSICTSIQKRMLVTHTRQTCKTMRLAFSQVSFPLKYMPFPSALLLLSKLLYWIFLSGWVNDTKKQKNFDPIPTVKTSLSFLLDKPASKHESMCDTICRKTFQKTQMWQGLGSAPVPSLPPTLHRNRPVKATPRWACLWQQCIYGSHTNGAKHPFITLIFTQIKPNSIRKNEDVLSFPCLWNHRCLEAFYIWCRRRNMALS